MDVFISWSGERSFGIARALTAFLRSVLDHSVFFSDDIELGELWRPEIVDAARCASTCIAIVLPENYLSPWLVFEAGLISAFDRKKLVILRFDGARLAGPLAGLQESPFSEETMERLVRQLMPDPISERDRSRIEKRRKDSWPSLQLEISVALGKVAPKVDGVHHMNLMVSDLARSREFYEGILGLRNIDHLRNKYDWGVEGHWFEVSKTQQLHLILETDPKRLQPARGYNKRKAGRNIFESPHLAFSATNFVALVGKIRKDWEKARGYEFYPLPEGVGPFAQAYTRDPDGYVIEINAAEH